MLFRSVGRPGWHIECSAMAKRYLGEKIDLHCGAVDLVFPHHENEIAQSECANGCEFANYWLHLAFLNVDNQKMSKSLGNFFMTREAAKVYGYAAIRIFVLMSHYRSPINYSEESLSQSAAALARIKFCLDRLDFLLANVTEKIGNGEIINRLPDYQRNFVRAMNDDFNTADAVSVIFELVRDINSSLDESTSAQVLTETKQALVKLIDVLGIIFDEEESVPKEILELVEKRHLAREKKDYAESDIIRDRLAEKGYAVKDTKQGPQIYKI